MTTRSAKSTRAVARRIGAALAPGSVLAFTGDLGAGKTTFIQGLAEGVRVSDTTQVLSPTYTLVNEYPGTGPTLVHIDFYRLDSADAARALGIDEQIGRPDAVVAIEWAERLPDLVPSGAIRVRIEAGEGNLREVEIIGLAEP